MPWTNLRCLVVLAVTGLTMVACSSDESAGASKDTVQGGAAGSPGGSDVNGGIGATPGGTITSSSFRYGFNAGYPNPAFSDQDLAKLGIAAGVTSERVSLPESHLDRWGYEIEVADVKAYHALGMGSLVGFLTSPIRAHSTAPVSVADWELVHYIPANLYEPVLGADGAINPQNYWADYVYRVVSIYHEWIQVWEIWNEPDWVSDWALTQQWPSRAPVASDLPRFNGSIYDYVRMLRVSREAAKLADPNALIATGGIGYPSFLDAVLRYSDEPTSGKIDEAHPKTGADYIDVVSFHHYPIYTAGNSESALESFLGQKAALELVTEAHGRTYAWECTETGAPHRAVGTFPGGDEYARNYLMKAMASAHEIGMSGLHWFVLSDGAAAGASDDPYSFMGLYHPVGSLSAASEARLTDSGVAYRTLTSLLSGASFDAEKTSAIRSSLPSNVRTVAYLDADRRTRLVLWAAAAAGSESASQDVELTSERDWVQFAWDASKTSTSVPVSSRGGTVTLTVLGSPSIVFEQ